MKRFILIGIIVTGILFYLALYMCCSENSSPDKVSSVPSYSGITVEEIIVQNIEEGRGNEIIQGDRVQVYLGVWVYDPASPKNRGDQLFYSLESRPESFVITQSVPGLEKYLIGMKEKGIRNIVVPPKDHQLLDAYGITFPKEAILLVELRVFDVF